MSIVCVEHIEHKKSKTENYKAIDNEYILLSCI